MTPKEKAKRLVNKFINNVDFNCEYTENINAKNCSLLCIREKLELLDQLDKTLKVKWQKI